MSVDFEKWQQSIGRLVLACSRVEYELMRFYERKMPNDSYYEDSYLKRFDKAIGVAKIEFGEDSEIVEGLIEVRGIANVRHTVAHNPIHYSNQTDNWHIFDLKTKKDSVTLEELNSLAEAVDIRSIKLSSALRIQS